MVRRNVARSELMELTPIFPKMAVSAAKNAEPTAKAFQLAPIPLGYLVS
jgi:hypothetical protein